jgi:hypothetical protein
MFTKILVSALIAANVLVLAGIARADSDSPAPSTPTSTVSTFVAPAPRKAVPQVQWNVVQVCNGDLSVCTYRNLTAVASKAAR